MKSRIYAVAMALALSTTAVEALPVLVPVPSNAFITVDGLDWAWAAPCAAFQSCGDIDLTFQSQFGWRLPTVAEFAVHPEADEFIFPGANVPNGGSDPNGAHFQAGSPDADAACAAPYFSVAHTHCDWGDGVSGIWSEPPYINNGVPEQLVVRGQLISGVPEPGTLSILGLGSLLLGLQVRRGRGRRQR